MPSPQSSSDPTPVPAPAPVTIPVSPVMEAAKAKYNNKEITLAELVKTHKRVIVENSRKGIQTREEFIDYSLKAFRVQNGVLVGGEEIPIPSKLKEAKINYNNGDISLIELVKIYNHVYIKNAKKGIYVADELVRFPLSFFSFQNGILTCADYTRVKPLPPVDHSKLPKTLREAKELFRRGKINVQEYRTAITDIGTNNEDSFIFWNPETDIRPGLKGNNKSRFGFLKDCGSNIAGAYLQGVVKKAILAAINMAHHDWTKQYDKDAFVYEDPYLIYLDAFLKKYMDEHIPEKASYRDYHMDLFSKIIDLFCGVQKEDVIYRVMGKDILNNLAGKVLFPLTPEEQEHFDLWCHK